MDTVRVMIVDDDTALLQALPQAIALRMKNAKVDIWGPSMNGPENNDKL